MLRWKFSSLILPFPHIIQTNIINSNFFCLVHSLVLCVLLQHTLPLFIPYDFDEEKFVKIFKRNSNGISFKALQFDCLITLTFMRYTKSNYVQFTFASNHHRSSSPVSPCYTKKAKAGLTTKSIFKASLTMIQFKVV